MATTSSANSNNTNLMAIKQEAIHQPDVSLPTTTNTNTTITTTGNNGNNTNNSNNSNNNNNNNTEEKSNKMVLDDDSTEDEKETSKIDPTGMRIPKKERHEIPPPVLEHKLRVTSSDGRIKNLLCPIELVMESRNYSAPLIPHRYESEIFCLFQNVNENCYVATTPKISSRKRKNNDNNSSKGNPSKKRKKSSASPRSKQNKSKSSHRSSSTNGRNHNEGDEDIDLRHSNNRSNKHSNNHRDEDYFSYQPSLNVNSRPKRQRKKVSYREPDPNQVPIKYIPTKQTTIPKKKVVNNKYQQQQHQQQQQYQQVAAATIEMKWVQCDKCLKWRRIPASIRDEELEGEWECKMNKWDLKRNSCSAPEENYDLNEEQTVAVSNTGNRQNVEEKKLEFYRELEQFYISKEMRDKNLNINQVKHSKIGNKIIDFNQLYLEVTKRGGYHYCIQSKLFDQVFVSLQCFQQTQTKYANQILQQLYSKYLYDYERTHFNQLGHQLSPVQSIQHSQSGKSHNLQSNF